MKAIFVRESLYGHTNYSQNLAIDDDGKRGD